MAVLGVGVIAEVRAFVDEALSGGVDHDAQGIAVFLKAVADGQIAERRRVAVPADGVAAGPVAGRHGADVKRHADAVAGVEARTADRRQVPAGAEIPRPPFGVGLEAARRQHHGARPDIEGVVAFAGDDATDRALLDDQLHGPGSVKDFHAGALDCRRQPVYQPRPAAPGFQAQSTPELEPAVDLERLAAEGRLEADALFAHPDQGFEAVVDERLDQVRVGPVAGEAGHVVEILVAGVGAEIGVLDLFVGQLRHHLQKVLDAIVGKPDGAGGEAAVSAAFVKRGSFQHQHGCTLFTSRQRRCHRCIAGADNHHIAFAFAHFTFLFPKGRSPGAFSRKTEAPHKPGRFHY